MWLYKYYSNVTFDEKILTNGVRGAIMQFVNEVVSRKQTHTKIIKVLNLKGGNTKMKKFISLALAAAMTLSLVPVSAFAASDNRVNKVVTVTKDTVLDASAAPSIVITDDKGDLAAAATAGFEFGLQLDGAEFSEDSSTHKVEGVTATIGGTSASGTVDVKFVSKTYAMVTVNAGANLGSDKDGTITISLGSGTAGTNEKGVKVTSETAKVTIDPRSSAVSPSTFTFAKSADGATLTTVDGTKDFQDGGSVNNIVIEEVAPNSLKDGGKVTLKLNSGFEFASNVTVDVISADGTFKVDADSSAGGEAANITATRVSGDNRTIEFWTDGSTSAKPAMIRISGIKINEDGADFGDMAEITVSGDDVTKTTLEVGKLIDFSVSASVEDKDLPTIYSGNKIDGDNNETLKVTVKENALNSWLTNRKTTFTFPEGVKVDQVNVEDYDGFKAKPNANNNGSGDFKYDGNEVTFAPQTSTQPNSGYSDKLSLELTFDLIVSPEFEGDITCKVAGSAVGEETELKVAKAVKPVAVEAEKTSVAIDYRNVEVGDITVTEAEAGLWEKGQKITLDAENMTFESGMKAEVVEGDGEIKDLKVTGGNVVIEVKSTSSKTPMKIKLSNASLYLDRTLPAGDYKLSVVGNSATDVMFETYHADDKNDPSASGFGFDVDSVDIMKDYVTVATAGRDQGTTFTTEVAVTIDSTTMLVDGKEKTLDVPAYLSAEGWTMLPVRAVTEALATSSNSQPIDWIAGNPGTIMIYYGDKTVAMTLGSTTMYINGTPVPMSTAPVIVNDRAFLPMRDLGRALGLSDDQIKWDATTRTATFNPAATTTTTK